MMLDLLMLGLVLAGFTAAWAYADLCQRLLFAPGTSGENKDVKN